MIDLELRKRLEQIEARLDRTELLEELNTRLLVAIDMKVDTLVGPRTYPQTTGGKLTPV